MIPIRRVIGLVLAPAVTLSWGCSNHPSRVLTPARAAATRIESPARLASARAPSAAIEATAEAPCDPGYKGPVITLSGPGFQHQYPTGGYCVCPSAEVPVDVPANRKVTFHWSADASSGCTQIFSYRWTLDIADVLDQTPRIDEATDLDHWSAPSATGTSATVGPFALGPDPHFFYVDIGDRLGHRSLGIIRINVVPAVNQPPDLGQATAVLVDDGPPNGALARVAIAGVTDPDGDPVSIAVTSVSQDEPLDGAGDGHTCPDAKIEAGVGFVRRERSGGGNGRVYTIGFTASDGNGGTAQGTAAVCIPQGSGASQCIKDALVVNSLAGCNDVAVEDPPHRYKQPRTR